MQRGIGMAGRVRARLRRFVEDCGGATGTVETVIFLPVVFLGLLTVLVLSDMFRSQTVSLRAAYSVGDTLSRRVDPVDAPYLDGAGQLYRYLGEARHGTWMRISSIAWSEAQNRFFVVWSHHTEDGSTLNTSELNQGLHQRLPSMPEGETVILVEAGTEWRSPMVGMFAHREFRQVVVTRPRFTPQLRFDDGDMIIFLPDGGGTCDDGFDLCDPDDGDGT